MKTHSIRSPKSALAMAAALALLPMQPALAANCTWNPATGNWNVAANWSCGSIPGAADIANVAITKVVTINDARSILTLVNGGGVNIDAFLLTLGGGGSTTNTGTINIGAGPIPNNAALNVSAGHNITNTGGVINISADSVLNQFGSTISGGTINSIGTGKLVAFSNGSNFLSNVTLNGTMDMASNVNSRQRVVGGLTLGGGAVININSNGILSFEGTQTLGGTGSIVLGNTGAGNRIDFDGNGTTTFASGITVRGENGTIGLQLNIGGTQNLLNNGTISADVAGGTITITQSNVTNNGTLSAANGGTLVLNSDVIGSATGQILAGAGSSVLQSGVTIGGIVNTSGGGLFTAVSNASNFLTGVTLNGNLDMASVVNSRERVSTGGLVLNGAININQNGILSFEGDGTLSGTGSIVFGNTGTGNRIDLDGTGTTTFASGITVRGENGTIGQQLNIGGTQTLVNNGLISADVAGGTITITQSNVTNNGTLSATNGGTLVLGSNVTGSGTGQIVAGAGSQVLQSGVTISGIVNTSGSGLFTAVSSAANFFTGVTLNGNLDMASLVNSRERVSTGGLVLNGVININQNGILSFEGDGTLSGSGSIVLGNTGPGNRIDLDGNGTTTFASGITVRGENGTIGQQLNIGGTQTLVNNGLISADVNGGTITITQSNVTNNGVLQAINGGKLVLSSNVAGSATGQIVAGAGSQVLQNGVTIGGIINTSGGGLFTAVSSAANVLSGVTLNGNLDMASIVNSRERVTPGGLVLNGVININQNGILSFEGNGTLSGSGSIVLGNTGPGNRIDLDGNGTTTFASGITVRGENGTIGQQLNIGGTQTLVNNGLISADVSGGTITITDSAVTNTGRVEARNGGTLALNSNVSNSAAGVIRADNGVVLQQGARISGGTIESANGGVLRVTNSSTNFLDATTLTGVLDMATLANSRQRLNNGLTLNGTINLNANGILGIEGTSTLAGTGNIVFGNTGAGNRIDLEGSGTTTFASGVTVRGHSGTIGQQLNIGGTQTLVNNGTVHADTAGGLISFVDSALQNNGLLRASAGTLTVGVALTGTGTLQVDATGVMNLANGAKTQGTLAMGAAGSTLNLGTGNLTITSDYTNIGAGSGNSFLRRTGVNGTGLVVAGANAAQAITGTGVSNGATANATLTLGNVRVGGTTFNYQVANTGATGPSLRGAIQTNVNGAALNDARLTGVGVTPSNYNTGAPGNNSGNLGVTLTVANAGVLAPLVGQVLNLRSNFENIADQKLNIVLAAGAAAFNAAAGSTVTPVQVANQRVGGSNAATLAVTNTAAPGAFSEDLNASVGASAGQASGSGSILGRLAGTNNTGVGAISVSVDSASAGAKIGTVTINYDTAGTVAGVSNGLGTASAGSQTITVNGNIYLAAQASPAVLAAPINLGNFRAGAGAQAAPGIVITNTDLAPTGFQEGLAAAIMSTSGQATGTGFSNAVAGGSGTLNLGLSGINAGNNTGTVGVQLRSNGSTTTGSNGLGNLDLGALQTITVNATGYRLAAPNAIAPVNFGNVLANSVQTRTLTISNNATADGFSEALNAAFGVFGGANAASFSGAGAIAGLLAGGSDNTTMMVTLNTSTTGTRTANVQILLDSNGTAIGNGLGLTPLTTQVINLDGLITAVVGNLASAGLSPTTVNFGKFREGAASQTQQLTITNLTPSPGEGLNASFGAATLGVSNNGGSIASLATNAAGNNSNNTAMSVTLGGLATAGNKTGSQVVNFVSDGSFNNGTPTNLPSQTVNLSADVYRLATAGANTPINLAARRVGDAAATGTLTLSNTAAADGFSEGLRGTIGAAPAGFTVAGAPNTALIAAGANEQRTVSLATTTASNFAGNVNIAVVSDGAGTSDFGERSIGEKIVALAGKVYTAAVGQLATAAVNFGVVRVGDVVAARNVDVNNTAAATALNDTLTATLSGAASPFSAGGPANGIAAQGSGQVAVGLTAATAGVYNVNANMAFLSRNPDMADASAGADASVNLMATINSLANADFDFLSGLGLLTQNGSDYVLDLGNIALNSTINSLLRIDNDVAGPADILGGSFDLSGVNDFALTGWGAVAGLAAGDGVDTLMLSYLASQLGAFQDSIVFNGLGTNASDPEGLAQTRRLIIRANVIDPDGQPVPEPGSLALLLAAGVAAAIVRRRRKP